MISWVMAILKAKCTFRKLALAVTSRDQECQPLQSFNVILRPLY